MKRIEVNLYLSAEIVNETCKMLQALPPGELEVRKISYNLDALLATLLRLSKLWMTRVSREDRFIFVIEENLGESLQENLHLLIKSLEYLPLGKATAVIIVSDKLDPDAKVRLMQDGFWAVVDKRFPNVAAAITEQVRLWVQKEEQLDLREKFARRGSDAVRYDPRLEEYIQSKYRGKFIALKEKEAEVEALGVPGKKLPERKLKDEKLEVFNSGSSLFELFLKLKQSGNEPMETFVMVVPEK
jgi:hypothetical protein